MACVLILFTPMAANLALVMLWARRRSARQPQQVHHRSVPAPGPGRPATTVPVPMMTASVAPVGRTLQVVARPVATPVESRSAGSRLVGWVSGSALEGVGCGSR